MARCQWTEGVTVGDRHASAASPDRRRGGPGTARLTQSLPGPLGREALRVTGIKPEFKSLPAFPASLSGTSGTPARPAGGRQG
jgi:hypothetical protein